MQTEQINGISTQQNTYNNYRQLSSKSQFGLKVADYTYHANGELATVTDNLGRTTGFSDYYRGAPRRTDYPDQSYSTASVNNSGTTASITDQRGSTNSFQYDGLNRPTLISFPTGDIQAWANRVISYYQTTISEFGTPAGVLRERSTLGRHQVSTYYDGQLRPTLVEDKDTTTGIAIYTSSAYDGSGRLAFRSYPSWTYIAARGVNYSYDALDRLTKKQTTDGVVLEQIAYLTGGRKQITDADSKVTTITYQSFGGPDESRPILIEAPENQTTSIARDIFGKTFNVTQSGGWSGGNASATRTFDYDIYQRLCRRVDPESGSTLWGYNAASEIAWEAKGQGGVGCSSVAPADSALFEYWPRGNKKKDDYPGTSEDVSYYYDDALNLTAVSNPTATWTYSYNRRNLLESETVAIDGRTFVLDPVYNSLGQVASLVTPGQTLTYAPNAWGQPTRVGSTVSSIMLYPNGLASDYVLGNGLTYEQNLDTQQRPTSQLLRDGNSTIQRYVYGYSLGSDLLSIDDTVDNTNDLTARYDGLHRLDGARGIWGSYGFTYDSLNNIRARYGSSPLTFTYGTDNRLNSISGNQSRTYSYNAKGEVIHDGRKPAVLNNHGQVISITGVATYAYDGNARRIKTVKGGATEYTLYDQSGALVYTESGGTGTDFVRVGTQTVAELKKVGDVTTTTYLHPDLLGSPRMATSQSKSILWQEHYDPYGRKLNNVTDKIGYTGHAYDPETGYTYMQARFYDPLVGRFYSTDPVHFKDQNPFTFNRYAYANNNPYKYADPDGKFAQAIFGAAAGAAIDLYVQIAIQGKSLSQVDISDLAVAMTAGAVTGGVASASTLMASRGLITVGNAIGRTAATGFATGTTGSVVKSVSNGESPSAVKTILEGALSAAGAGAGTRLTLAPLAKLEDMAARGGIPSLISETTSISETTRSTIIGSDKAVVSATTSEVGSKIGEGFNAVLEGAKAEIERRLNDGS